MDFEFDDWKYLFKTHGELDLKEYGFLSLVSEQIETDNLGYDNSDREQIKPMTCLQQDINFQVTSGRGSIKRVRLSLEKKGWIKSEPQIRGKSHVIRPTLPKSARAELERMRQWEEEAKAYQ